MKREKGKADTYNPDRSVLGTCCSCGYSMSPETPCEKRDDRTHCSHWWDGTEDEAPTIDTSVAPKRKSRKSRGK